MISLSKKYSGFARQTFELLLARKEQNGDDTEITLTITKEDLRAVAGSVRIKAEVLEWLTNYFTATGLLSVARNDAGDLVVQTLKEQKRNVFFSVADLKSTVERTK